MKKTGCSVSLFLSMIIVLVASIAQAEITMCTPIHQSEIPYTINTPGIYCLATDLVAPPTFTTGNVITINSNNVVIDLNDHRIGGQPAGLGNQAVGIYSNSHRNIQIRNGVIRGFLYGIQIVDAASPGTSSGIAIVSILADGNTYAGIDVVGLGNRIHDNSVVNTGGSTAPPTAEVFGISSKGKGSIIRDNVVTAVTHPTGGSAYAIFIDASSDYSTVDNNRITNPSSSASSFGIYVNSSDVLVQGNVVFGMDTGLSFKDTTGAYRNNAVIKTNTPVSKGFDGGGNVSNP